MLPDGTGPSRASALPCGEASARPRAQQPWGGFFFGRHQGGVKGTDDEDGAVVQQCWGPAALAWLPRCWGAVGGGSPASPAVPARWDVAAPAPAPGLVRSETCRVGEITLWSSGSFCRKQLIATEV